jgi:hypothetical protein
MIPLLVRSLLIVAFICIGVIMWRMSLSGLASRRRDVTVSRAWLQRQNGGGRE